jgi:hypothetical protein
MLLFMAIQFNNQEIRCLVASTPDQRRRGGERMFNYYREETFVSRAAGSKSTVSLFSLELIYE